MGVISSTAGELYSQAHVGQVFPLISCNNVKFTKILPNDRPNFARAFATSRADPAQQRLPHCVHLMRDGSPCTAISNGGEQNDQGSPHVCCCLPRTCSVAQHTNELPFHAGAQENDRIAEASRLARQLKSDSAQIEFRARLENNVHKRSVAAHETQVQSELELARTELVLLRREELRRRLQADRELENAALGRLGLSLYHEVDGTE